LTPNAPYTVRLHFAEIYYTQVGQRWFNVRLNGTQIISNLDLVAVAGVNTAYVLDFAANASASGAIVVEYVNVKDTAQSNGLEILAASGSSPPPETKVYQINAGGGAVGTYSADKLFTSGTTYSANNAINTSAANAAPAAAYQSERYGNHSYNLNGLTPNAAYTVRLHFAEIYYTQVGQRYFNVQINGTQVLSNLDLVAVAGANTAYVRDFPTTANASGAIVVSYVNVKDTAKSSAIEVISSGTGSTPVNQAPTVSGGAAASPSTVTGTTTGLSVLGADDGGEGNLTYTWATTGSPPGSVVFSANGSNAAKSTTATFSASGNYTFQATITDAQGLTAISSVNVSVTIPAGLPGGSGWKLVWSDEFNGSSVDTTLWNYWLDGQQRRSAVNHAANTFVSNGVLTVRTTQTNGQLTAGGLQSKRGFGSGYFEIRGRTQGWSAFWLQSPANGNGGTPAVDGTEMDIMETCCGPANHAVHWGGYGASHQSVMQFVTLPLSDWNTYGLEWTPTSYKFWVNGQLSWTFTTAISQRTDEWIRLTQETDGDFCGGQCDFLVDYVRVYTPN
jgi:hypothetical protein